MPSVGGVISAPPPADEVGAAWRVTVTDLATRLVPDVAVIVTTLEPTASGIFEAVHADAGANPGPEALPEPPLETDHVTEMAPGPPHAAPDKVTVEAVEVPGGAFTVSISGATAGGDGGAGAGLGGRSGAGVTGGALELSCAAYSVKTAALSSGASVVTIL